MRFLYLHVLLACRCVVGLQLLEANIGRRIPRGFGVIGSPPRLCLRVTKSMRCLVHDSYVGTPSVDPQTPPSKVRAMTAEHSPLR